LHWVVRWVSRLQGDRLISSSMDGAIHPLEYQATIATYGYAVPGRYWMEPRETSGWKAVHFFSTSMRPVLGKAEGVGITPAKVAI
jgi:hypothetical protein